MPFWKTFFTALGFRIVFSDRTNKRLIHKGVERIVAETCFPIKIAHGHLLDLIDKGVDTIFLPSVINMPLTHHSLDRSFTCPYVQAFPDSVKSALDFKSYGVKLLSPVVHFGWERKNLEQALIKMCKELGKKRMMSWRPSIKPMRPRTASTHPWSIAGEKSCRT